jgi:hypothetical protein
MKAIMIIFLFRIEKKTGEMLLSVLLKPVIRVNATSASAGYSYCTGYSGSYVTPGLMLPAGLLVTLRVPELGVPTKGARAARETFAWVCNLAAKPSLDAKRLSGPSGDPHGHGHGCCCLGLSDPRLLHTRDQQAHAA